MAAAAEATEAAPNRTASAFGVDAQAGELVAENSYAV